MYIDHTSGKKKATAIDGLFTVFRILPGVSATALGPGETGNFVGAFDQPGREE